MIHHITFRVFSHATEDEVKVHDALTFIALANHAIDTERIEIDKIENSGHYGEPLSIISVKVTRNKDCVTILDFVRSSLSEAEISHLISGIDELIDDGCTFYLRFDKQAASEGILKICESSAAIACRIKVKVYPAKKELAVSSMRGFFSERQDIL